MDDAVATDEFTPRERGLLMGHFWATNTRQAGTVARDENGDAIDLVAAAAQETPQIATEVRDEVMAAGMRERLDASDDPDAEGAFWAGFRDGVRAYLSEIENGFGGN